MKWRVSPSTGPECSCGFVQGFLQDSADEKVHTKYSLLDKIHSGVLAYIHMHAA